MSGVSEPANEPRRTAKGDSEWLGIVNELLKPHGKQKELAVRIGTSETTITRMCQGKSVSTRVLYRASLALGIRPPTTLPPDDMQQRLMRALDRIRQYATSRQAEAMVASFEGAAQAVVACWT